jgi:hypothetical protein
MNSGKGGDLVEREALCALIDVDEDGVALQPAAETLEQRRVAVRFDQKCDAWSGHSTTPVYLSTS